MNKNKRYNYWEYQVWLTATVDPFLPFPSNKILFSTGGKLHNAQIVPNTSGQYLNGRKPSSWKVEWIITKGVLSGLDYFGRRFWWSHSYKIILLLTLIPQNPVPAIAVISIIAIIVTCASVASIWPNLIRPID